MATRKPNDVLSDLGITTPVAYDTKGGLRVVRRSLFGHPIAFRTNDDVWFARASLATLDKSAPVDPAEHATWVRADDAMAARFDAINAESTNRAGVSTSERAAFVAIAADLAAAAKKAAKSASKPA